jgi:hypothetical protein
MHLAQDRDSGGLKQGDEPKSLKKKGGEFLN